MALIKCPECHHDVSDSAIQCPNCGYAVKEHVEREKRYLKYQEEARKEAYEYVKQVKQEELQNKLAYERRKKEQEQLTIIRQKKEKEAEEQKKQRNIKIRKLSIGIMILLLILIPVGIFLYYKILPEYQMNKSYDYAVELYENGKEEDALDLLKKNPSYKDSQDLINQILDFKYQQALAFVEKKQFTDAKEYFTMLDNYKDSQIKLERINSYEEALVYYRATQFEQAYSIFLGLGDFSESVEYAKKCQEILKNNNDLSNAMNAMNDFLGKSGDDYLFVDIFDEKYIIKAQFLDLGMKGFEYDFTSVQEVKNTILKNVNEGNKYNSYEEYLAARCEKLPITLKAIYSVSDADEVRTIGVEEVYNANHKYQYIWDDAYNVYDSNSSIQSLVYRVCDLNDSILQKRGPYHRIN